MPLPADFEIDNEIDGIMARCGERLSAEQKNMLHACRPDHPLGRGESKVTLFRNARFGCASGLDYRARDWLESALKQAARVEREAEDDDDNGED
jgi:hypothetical protein